MLKLWRWRRTKNLTNDIGFLNSKDLPWLQQYFVCIWVWQSFRCFERRTDESSIIEWFIIIEFLKKIMSLRGQKRGEYLRISGIIIRRIVLAQCVFIKLNRSLLKVWQCWLRLILLRLVSHAHLVSFELLSFFLLSFKKIYERVFKQKSITSKLINHHAKLSKNQQQKS